MLQHLQLGSFDQLMHFISGPVPGHFLTRSEHEVVLTDRLLVDRTVSAIVTRHYRDPRGETKVLMQHFNASDVWCSSTETRYRGNAVWTECTGLNASAAVLHGFDPFYRENNVLIDVAPPPLIDQ